VQVASQLKVARLKVFPIEHVIQVPLYKAPEIQILQMELDEQVRQFAGHEEHACNVVLKYVWLEQLKHWPNNVRL
jgi:hypothetical protein